MPKKINPKVRRQKAAELIEKAKEEAFKRKAEIGDLFEACFLTEKPKANHTLESFKQKAAEILGRSTKKQPSPQDMQATANEYIQEAEQEEAERQRAIGEKVLEILSRDPAASTTEIQKAATRIWQE